MDDEELEFKKLSKNKISKKGKTLRLDLKLIKYLEYSNNRNCFIWDDC